METEAKKTKPWQYVLPDTEGTELWKRGLGEAFEDVLEEAGNFHMRLSWKTNGAVCMTVFEAWGDTDNDGYFFAAVDAIVENEAGDILESKKALVSRRPGSEGRLPKTRIPGAPVPLTLDVFFPDPRARQVLDEYIQGAVDGTDYSGPLEDYTAWREKQVPL